MTRSGFLRTLLAVLGDADGAFRRGKGLVAGQEAEALRLFAQQHGAQVAVAEADFALFRDGAGDAERLQAHADGLGGVGGVLAALLDGDGGAERVGPARRFQTRWAARPGRSRRTSMPLSRQISSASSRDCDAVFGQAGLDLGRFFFRNLQTVPLLFILLLDYFSRGSMYFAASS